jgi:hypothetical protein
MCGSPAGQDVGAEEVAPGHLTAVCATFLGELGGTGIVFHPAPTAEATLCLVPQLDAPNLLRVRSRPMPLDFRTKRVPFDTPLAGPQTKNDAVFFGSNVKKANVAVKAFKLDFKQFAERMNAVEVTARGGVDAPTGGNEVSFSVTIQYADQNANAQFTGFVEVLVIADVV